MLLGIKGLEDWIPVMLAPLAALLVSRSSVAARQWLVLALLLLGLERFMDGLDEYIETGHIGTAIEIGLGRGGGLLALLFWLIHLDFEGSESEERRAARQEG